MIFSEWNPDGGYNYYLAAERHGIGDDLPDAALPAPTNGIGVPAQDAGRQVPRGAKKVGQGPIARGVIAPMERSQVLGLSGSALGEIFGSVNVVSLLIAGGLVWAGYELGRRA